MSSTRRAPEKWSCDASKFAASADYAPHIVQDIRYYSAYNFIGERVDGYEESCALLTQEAALALKAVSGELLFLLRSIRRATLACTETAGTFLRNGFSAALSSFG